MKSDDSGKFAVPAKIFQDFVKTYGATVDFICKDAADGNGSLLEILDEKDNFAVALDNAEDYPELPEFDAAQSVKISAGVLSGTVNNTLFATSNDSLRPVMTGVCSNLKRMKPISFLRILTDWWFTKNRFNQCGTIEFIMPKKPLAIFKKYFGKFQRRSDD